MSQFPFTRQAVKGVLLLTLTMIMAVTSDQEFDEAYYKTLGAGYTYDYLETSPTQQFPFAPSLLECARIALNSQSEFFTYNNVRHVCKNYSPKNIMTVKSTNDNNGKSFYRSDGWIKVYALSMGAGSAVYNSFMNIGSPSSWKVDTCNGVFCPNFFRHPILDLWNSLPIDEVKLVLYKNQSDVATLIFNGRNTTHESWFSLENLISSPWNDIAPSLNPLFSIEGAWIKRRFAIALHLGGCDKDAGWLTINEGKLYCGYEIADHYPSIRYSSKNSKVVWSEGYALADSFAIFIRLRQ